MSKFFLVAVLGITLLLIISVFILAGNQKLNLLAFVENALEVLFFGDASNKQQDLVYFPENKKEAKKEEESNGSIEEETKKEPDLNLDLSLDKITEEIDEISEKIDLLNQEVEEFLAQSPKKEEIVEKPEEKDEQELKKEDKKEENEELNQEGIENGEKVPKQDLVLCQKENQNPFQDIVIFNEISWMGTIEDWRNEWIEFKNISNSDISLKNWQILDKDQEIKVIFEENDKILAGQFFLLERTNDDSVPNISADKIYSGNLNNEDEVLYLFDENCQLRDEILANPNWPAGDKTAKRTMERKTDFNWQSSLNNGGTPKIENSFGYTIISGGGASSPAPSYPKIFISEIMIFPIEQRFIELFNPNNYEVNLTEWYIQRKTKTGTSWDSLVSSNQFEGKIIPANSYFVITRSIIENFDILLEDLTLTDDNAILIKNPDRQIVDKVGWGESLDFETSPALNPISGRSLGRKFNEENQVYQDTDNNSDDFEIQDPSLNSENQSSIIPSPVLEDNIPPQVAFDQVSSLRADSSFSISWVGQDFAPEAVKPSGIAGFYLKYDIISSESTVTPPDVDGIAIQYQDIYNEWQEWQIGQILEFEEDKNSVSILGKEKKTFSFSIKTKDKAGNESEWNELTIEINFLPVVINEIAWMGTEVSYNNEWVELFNNTNQNIDLIGWILKASDGTPEINLVGTILAKNYYLLERTDDNTLPDILADQIYTGALGNNSEDFKIFDNSGKLIDSVAICEKGWCAGDNETKQTMERINPLLQGDNFQNWASSFNPGGTPKNQNSQFIQ